MSPMRVFISHSHQDNAFCREIVNALRNAGADVWFDEQNFGSGTLLGVIQQELLTRPVFIVVLSNSAFQSIWVKNEMMWAFNLFQRDPSRIILPVTAEKFDPKNFDSFLFLEGFKRIEAGNCEPFPQEDAVKQILHSLALSTDSSSSSGQPTISPNETIESLLERGKGLIAQGKVNEARYIFERTTHMAPQLFDVWFYYAFALFILEKWEEAIQAFDRALDIKSQDTSALGFKGISLRQLKKYDEAISLLEQSIDIDPYNAKMWNELGITLEEAGEKLYALATYERSLTLERNNITLIRKLSLLKNLGDLYNWTSSRYNRERVNNFGPTHKGWFSSEFEYNNSQDPIEFVMMKVNLLLSCESALAFNPFSLEILEAELSMFLSRPYLIHSRYKQHVKKVIDLNKE